MTIATRLRPARADDVPALASLCAELGYPSSAEQVAQRLGLLIRDPGHMVLVAVDDSDLPIGWVHAGIVLRLESDPVAELGGMVVAEGWRGQGIGRALLDAAESWARALPVQVLRVRSNIIRERAHRFYLRAGYTQTKTSHMFRKPLEIRS